jgi:hypothetical protein
LHGALAALICLIAATSAARAQSLVALRYTPDITVLLGGTIIGPAEVVEDDLAGMVLPVDIGTLPPDAHVDAYHLLPNGDQLLSFDTTVGRPGGETAEPADIVRLVGSTYVLVFDASARGVPAGVNVDAVAESGDGLLVSFDIAVEVSGAVFEDEDLVRVTGMVPPFETFFNGSDAEVPPELDLDAADLLSPTRLLASFDGSGSIDGVAFDDEDVLEFDDDSDTWTVVYDGSAHHAALGAADLVAVYGVVSGGPTATPTPIVTGGPGTPTATPPTGPCVGDCDDNGMVAINELVTMVNIALGSQPVANCLNGDPDDCGQIAINELIQAVNNALNGC